MSRVPDVPRPSPAQAFFAALRAAILPAAAALWAALGTFWTIFAWYHQEIVVPSTAPVNLTTEVTVEQVGFADQAHGPSAGLEAIQLSITATNVSSRNVYLLSNYWDAWAGKVTTGSKSDDEWLETINKIQSIQASGGFLLAPYGKYYHIESFERIAWGNVFPVSYFLYPKETVSASIVFFVPKGNYDLVHVEVHIPTTENRKNVDLTFTVDKDRVTPRYFKVDANGTQKEVVDTDEIVSLQIQETQSRKQLSLWQNGMPSPSNASQKR
jgi:hypothetical protein